jgi:uncharacterized membrane protein
MTLDALLAILGVLGFLIALYFTLVTYGLMRPDPQFLPRGCRMDEQTCRSIIGTDDARLFGIPNALVGIPFYAGIVWLGMASIDPIDIGYRVVLMASFATVFVSAYLAYSLIARSKTVCLLCFASHGINVSIATLLVANLLR